MVPICKDDTTGVEIHDNHLGGKFSLAPLQAGLMIDRSGPSSRGKQNRRQSIPNLKPHSRNTAFRVCSLASPPWEIWQNDTK